MIKFQLPKIFLGKRLLKRFRTAHLLVIIQTDRAPTVARTDRPQFVVNFTVKFAVSAGVLGQKVDYIQLF